MAIRYTKILGVAALVGVTTLVTSQVVSQQYEKDMGDMQKQMMEQWKKMAQPGKEHAKMMKAVGRWQQENTYWMYPGAEPTTSTSTAEMSSLMGGRFMMEKVHGKSEWGGEVQEFEGMGIFGYDNLKQKHVFAWIDSMGTMIMTGEGTADASGDVITYFSEMPNPAGAGMTKMKSVSRRESDDKNVLEMYEQQPDGSWHQNMKIVSTRAGGKQRSVGAQP